MIVLQNNCIRDVLDEDEDVLLVYYKDYITEVSHLRETIVRLEKYHNETVKRLLGV